MSRRRWFRSRPVQQGDSVRVSKSWLKDMLGGGDKVTVPTAYSAEAALAFPAVGAAVRLVSREVSRMKLEVVQLRGGEWEPVDSADPEARLLTGAWWPYQTKAQSIALMVRSMCLEGSAAAWVDVRGRTLRGIRVLDPDLVARNVVDGEVVYKYTGFDGPPMNPARNELLWVPYDPWFQNGKPPAPMSEAWPAVRLALLATLRAAVLFERGGFGGMIYGTGDSSNELEKQALSEDVWKETEEMNRRGYDEKVLPPDVKVLAQGGGAKDAQLIELMTYAVQDVARIFGLSPVALAELSRGTYSNADQSVRFISRFTLSAIAQQLSDELSYILWPAGGRRARLVSENIGDESRKETAERLVALVNNRIMTQNEAREVLGLKKDPDAACDELRGAPVPAMLPGGGVPGPAPGGAGEEEDEPEEEDEEE